MKKLRLLIALLFLASISFTSCSVNDDPIDELDNSKLEQKATDNNDDDPAPPEPPTGS